MCRILDFKNGRFLFFLMLLLVSFSGRAQDIHSSQFWLNPIGLNPAAAGFFSGNLRFGGYNRTQWRSVSKAFQTNGICFDMPLVKRPAKQDLFGFGLLLDYDQTGDSKYTTIDANMLFSYAHALNYRNNNFLMGGISLGCVQRSWDYTELSFDEMFIDGFYDPRSPISETFMGSNLWFFDCGLGVQWFYQPDYNEFYQAGFSIYHINRPEISMLANKEVRLDIKYVLHGISSIAIDDKNAIIPAAYLAFQNKYREMILGASYSHQLPLDARGYLNKLKTGLYFRWKDAIYLTAGMDFRQCSFSIAYDFNVSKLAPRASHGRGGVEISVLYIVKKQRIIRIVPIPCTPFDK